MKCKCAVGCCVTILVAWSFEHTFFMAFSENNSLLSSLLNHYYNPDIIVPDKTKLLYKPPTKSKAQPFLLMAAADPTIYFRPSHQLWQQRWLHQARCIRLPSHLWPSDLCTLHTSTMAAFLSPRYRGRACYRSSPWAHDPPAKSQTFLITLLC